MARIIFVTGGCRSGKSAFALEKANLEKGEKYFLATSPHLDEEMDARISRHKKEREGAGWQTIEEETELLSIFQNVSFPQNSVILLDCLSLWINNLMYKSQTTGKVLDQDQVQTLSQHLGQEIINSSFQTAYIVTNEVGLGLVPENKEGRLFRDLLGISNQTFAALAEEVYFLVSGIPICIKHISEGFSK